MRCSGCPTTGATRQPPRRSGNETIRTSASAAGAWICPPRIRTRWAQAPKKKTQRTGASCTSGSSTATMDAPTRFDESLRTWLWKREFRRFRVNNVVFRQVPRPQHAPPLVTGHELRANSDGDRDLEEEKERAQDKAVLVVFKHSLILQEVIS